METREDLAVLFREHLVLLNENNSFKAKGIFASNYSVFAFNDTNIYKFRKYDNAFLKKKGNIKRTTKSEYDFGKSIQSDIYIELVDLKTESDYIDSIGIKMNYIDPKYNSYLFHTPVEHLSLVLIKRLKLLFQAPAILNDKYSYHNGLCNGNKRVMNILSNRVKDDTSTFILSLWQKIENITKSLDELLQTRSFNRFVCHLHGDFSFENSFLVGDSLKLIDPCCYFNDMYFIDKLYQIADFMVEVFTFRNSDYYFIYEQVKSNFNTIFNEDLFKFYFSRHLLIRATLNNVFNNAKKEKYLKSLYLCQNLYS